jgi:hypothetical protein
MMLLNEPHVLDVCNSMAADDSLRAQSQVRLVCMCTCECLHVLLVSIINYVLLCTA